MHLSNTLTLTLTTLLTPALSARFFPSGFGGLGTRPFPTEAPIAEAAHSIFAAQSSQGFAGFGVSSSFAVQSSGTPIAHGGYSSFSVQPSQGPVAVPSVHSTFAVRPSQTPVGYGVHSSFMMQSSQAPAAPSVHSTFVAQPSQAPAVHSVHSSAAAPRQYHAPVAHSPSGGHGSLDSPTGDVPASGPVDDTNSGIPDGGSVAPIDPLAPNSPVAPMKWTPSNGKDEGGSFCLGKCYPSEEKAQCGKPYVSISRSSTRALNSK
ncbi:hypothetical protein NUU61_003762 [Penicillium alfredii]|uniref:Uncharacterized protein n=1 Tax=Penicillium alfredii TaxID=1506179 RepID=A0A9W9FK02_9EURO|nr:uncharacterized protein NUU61_003762 [Penicillium alfredii]KAJ5101540.1 hypothetical protein NUU61_003762 [Penicillium alfredii]